MSLQSLCHSQSLFSLSEVLSEPSIPRCWDPVVVLKQVLCGHLSECQWLERKLFHSERSSCPERREWAHLALMAVASFVSSCSQVSRGDAQPCSCSEDALHQPRWFLLTSLVKHSCVLSKTHIPFLDWTEVQFQNPLLFLVSLQCSLMFQRSVLWLCFQDVNIIDTLNSKHTLFAKLFPLKLQR